MFKLLGDDEDCRAVVVSGNGKCFTSGIDLAELMTVGSGVTDTDRDLVRKSKTLFNYIQDFQAAFTAVEKCRKPVIAAIHNACIGGGIDFIVCADIRLCSEDAFFSVKEVDMGLPADIGTLQRLPKVIGNQSLVRELCYTSRKFDAAEAEKCGLVSRVFKDKDALLAGALEMANDIAEKSPVAVQGTKVNLNYARDHAVQDGLDFIVRKCS